MLKQPLTPQQRRSSQLRILVTPMIFLISIGIAFWNDDLARFSWLTIAPILVIKRIG